MRRTVTVRLPSELADWLEAQSRQSGVPQARLVREAVERARAELGGQAFMHLAGSIRGARNLSQREGLAQR